jgi:anti-anti-sigma factor
MTNEGFPPGQLPGPGQPDGGGPPSLLEQEFDDYSLYALRAAVAAHASQAGLSDGRTGDLVLVVHELAANAIRHGAGHGRLRLLRAQDAVHCEITDEGAKAPRDAALWPVERGHGLWLVRQVADSSSLQSGPTGTVASVTFRLGPPEPEPFRLAQRFENGCAIVTVAGQLDLGSAGQFAAAVGGLIRSTPGLRLVLDLADLTVWDSSGLAALITAQRWIDDDPGARMVLAGLPGHLVQRLRDAGHAGRFTLVPNADRVAF